MTRNAVSLILILIQISPEAFSPYIDADELHVRSYVDVNIESLPSQAALIDGGSEICCINETLVQNLNVPVHKQVRISGLNQQSDLVNVVRLHVNPVNKEPHLVNIVPSVRVWFAVVPGLHEAVILTLYVVSLLHNVACYNVLAPCPSTEDIGGDLVNPNDADCDTDNTVSLPQTDTYEQMFTEPEINVAGEAIAFFDTQNPSPESTDRNADPSTLINEQSECPSLSTYWELAKQNKSGFYIEDGLLYHRDIYHRDTVLGHKVNQLCLPEKRVPVVLEMGHDAPFAGHMAVKSTCHRIKLNFWFPKMKDRIKAYCASCTICQLRAPVKVSD